ncbi:MAG: hypothetical protein R3B40_29410 [Polyangiales bacterium]|nr:hypothetical protein [Myxococcales bacterium]
MLEPKSRLHDAVTGLDDALVGLPTITDPGVPVDEVLGTLGAALRATYMSLATASDFGAFQEHLGRARDLARSSLELLQTQPSDDPAVGHVLGCAAAGFGALMEPGVPSELMALPGAAEPPVFRASTDEPRVLGTRADVFFPRLPRSFSPPVSEPPPEVVVVPPPPQNLEELRALTAKALGELSALDADEGRSTEAALEEPPALPEIDPESLIAEQFGLPVSQSAQRYENARQCFLDLGMFGCMRRPAPTERWASGERTERRLLARLDAVALCDDHIATRLLDELAEGPVPDPELTWGAVMLFGSLWGDDAVDQAFRVAKASDMTEDGMVESIGDAFALCANGAVTQRLARWLEDADERRVTVALHALGRRQALDAGRWNTATERVVSEPALLAAAEALEGIIGEPDGASLHKLLRGEHEHVARATLRSLLRRRSSVAWSFASHLRDTGQLAYADAAFVFALAGDASAAVDVFAAAQQAPSPGLFEALGWAGSLAAVEFLIGHIQHEDVALGAAALRALQRLTAAGLEGGEDLDAGEGGQLHDHYQPHEPPALLCTDPDHWMAWWTRNRPRVREGERYRHGHPWTLRDNVEEVRSEYSETASRAWACLELGVRAGRDVPLPLHHFVARQHKYFRAWTASVDERALLARGWPRAWANG